VNSGEVSAKRFTRPAYNVSRKGGKSVFIMKKTTRKSNINFVNDIPMAYVNVIIVVIMVSEKKRGLYLRTTARA
jgi:hypothetical protein